MEYGEDMGYDSSNYVKFIRLSTLQKKILLFLFK